MDSGELRSVVSDLEIYFLRGASPYSGFDELIAYVNEKATLDQTLPIARVLKLLCLLSQKSAEFYSVYFEHKVSLSDFLKYHIKFAEFLASKDSSYNSLCLWENSAGEDIANFITELNEAGNILTSLSGLDYSQIFNAMMDGVVVRYKTLHPRISILGPLEFRLLSPDFLILGGLNEGTWPDDLDVGPWLSRPMKNDLGLPTPERRVGQAAHDFMMAMGASEVLITRSLKINGSPTTASRWLKRLESCLGSPLETREDLKFWAQEIDNFNGLVVPYSRPAPCPELSQRPVNFSVTAIEKLIRDPYVVYAEKILGLRVLKPLSTDIVFSDFGNFLHKILDQFNKTYTGSYNTNAELYLIDLGKKYFGQSLNIPMISVFWWSKFLKIAKWFVKEESIRSSQIQSSLSEIKGVLKLQTSFGKFTISCKADRLDLLKDGTVSIIDYKTGIVPSWTDVEQGLSPQLVLESWIAEVGGFDNLLPHTVSEIAYWELKGGRIIAGDIKNYKKDLNKIISEAKIGIVETLNYYCDPGHSYVSFGDSDNNLRYSDFVHLSRLKEWSC